MAGKGDVTRPMLVDEMTGKWPEAEAGTPMPCAKCGRDIRLDARKKVVMANGAMTYSCVPRCR